jgi:hypothetical protein
MKTKVCLASLMLALSFPAGGALYSFGTLNGGPAIGAIPDNSTIGFSDARTLSGLGTSLTDVTLTFVLQGGFASDLSGYLRLGNLTDSSAYDVTSLVQSQTLSESTPVTYSVDFGTTFVAQNPNNPWTLYFGDQSPGGATTLEGWSLEITAVPEPVNVALGVFGGVTGLIALARAKPVKRQVRKRRCGRKRRCESFVN